MAAVMPNLGRMPESHDPEAPTPEATGPETLYKHAEVLIWSAYTAVRTHTLCFWAHFCIEDPDSRMSSSEL